MNYERSPVVIARNNEIYVLALKREPLWHTMTSVAMTISIMMPPGPLPIILRVLPDRNCHTFTDNVAYHGHSGIFFF